MDVRLESWAASGAMALTGYPRGEPVGPPAPLVDGLTDTSAALRAASRRAGNEVDVDGLALLGERAALAGLTRRGSISCGGSTRLLEAADGTLALALARPDDLAAVPAWLEIDAEEADPWPTIARVVRSRPLVPLLERAALVGLAAAGRGPSPSTDEVSTGAEWFGPWPMRVHSFGRAGASRALPAVVVVDLSALWAGPLCGQLLAEAGARVVKVESTPRPDGSRVGDPALFDLLNGPKESLALDFTVPRDRDLLRRVLAAADVVIESSRPRALEQLGIRAAELLAAPDGPVAWVSITGYGRDEPGAGRIAYGDVAAVAGGLVADAASGPCFYADAIADPITGLVAAVGVLDALASGERLLLDIAMVDAATRWAGPQLEVPVGAAPEPAPPRARTGGCGAPSIGADTAVVLDDLLT